MVEQFFKFLEQVREVVFLFLGFYFRVIRKLLSSFFQIEVEISVYYTFIVYIGCGYLEKSVFWERCVIRCLVEGSSGFYVVLGCVYLLLLFFWVGLGISRQLFGLGGIRFGMLLLLSLLLYSLLILFLLVFSWVLLMIVGQLFVLFWCSFSLLREEGEVVCIIEGRKSLAFRRESLGLVF